MKTIAISANGMKSAKGLGNELVGIKMVVDDFKMKWALIGVVGIAVILGAVSYFGPAITGMMGQ